MTTHTLQTHFGKVRTNTAVSATERVLTSSNRVSAFDSVLPLEIVNKGTLLQAVSVFFFTRTQHICANHFLGTLDSQSMLVRSGRVFPLEVIARATLSGSLWRCYSKEGPRGVSQAWGIELPEGMRQHQKLPETLITFTTKAAFGHDELIHADSVAACVQRWLSQLEHSGLSDAAHYLGQIKTAARSLFDFAQTHCEASGLLMLDTKYEFALDSNFQLMLVDEVHTPDSSRFVDLKAYNENRIEHFSKEWLRENIQTALESSEASSHGGSHSTPFVLHPIWQNEMFKKELERELGHRYFELFGRLFPQLKPWDVIAPHIIPWPVDPTAVRSAESSQRLPARVLVIGEGGRDYSLAKLFERQPEIDVVYCWPGRSSWNEGKLHTLAGVSESELPGAAASRGVGLAVIGPEAPIARGLAQKLRQKTIPCLAPDLNGAKLEVSKIYAKEILTQAGCPTAESWSIGWHDLQAATREQNSGTYARVLHNFPYVIKYEALAAGKGVCLVHNKDDLTKAVEHFEKNLDSWTRELSGLQVETYSRTRGEAQFLIEKLISGDEISAIALCHGPDFLLLPFARDFKRRNDHQQGPNTGGMGAVCPVHLPESLETQVRTIFSRTLKTLVAQGKPFHGFLFAGLMVDPQLNAQVLEFNCRLGDPETQVILPGLGRDFVVALWLTAQGINWDSHPWLSSNGQHNLTHDGLKRCFVVVASPEYPEASAPKRRLSLPHTWPSNIQWIPSGVDADRETKAGRIAGVLGTGAQEQEVVNLTYKALNAVGFEDSSSVRPHFRTDIAFPEQSKESKRT